MGMIGRIVGIVGGLLTIIGCILPWMTVQSSIASVSLWGILFIPFGTLAFIFGIIGLILVALGKRGPAIGAFVMGILAFIFVLLGWVMASVMADFFAGYVSGTGVTVTVDYGVYLALVGAIILMIGSILAMSEAKKAAEVPLMPGPMAPEPMPAEPMMEEPPAPPME